MNLDLIRKLQKNTTVFGELPEEEKECLGENLRNLQSFTSSGKWESADDFHLLPQFAYRIDPSWNPFPEPAEWIREKFEVCEIQVLTDKNGTPYLGIVRNGFAIRLSTLIDLPDFVGGVFEGALNVICPHVKAFAHTEGLCFISSSADNKPITAKWAVFSK